MMVDCSHVAKTALRDFAATSPTAYVEISTTITIVRDTGLEGEMHIAVLNHTFDVYFLEPASPGVPVLVVADPTEPNHCVVADIGRFTVASKEGRRQAAVAAAAGIGVIPTDIHLVP